jgi:predicted transcriptional regulator
MMGEKPPFRRDLLVSIRPKYASKIIAGEKTVELRRRFPEAEAAGAIALLYSSSPVRAVVGYARIRSVLRLPVSKIWREHGSAACISKKEFDAYFVGLKCGYAILLEDIKLLKKQLKASDLQKKFGIVPPQSYRYLHGDCTPLLSNGRIQHSDRHKRRHRA